MSNVNIEYQVLKGTVKCRRSNVNNCFVVVYLCRVETDLVKNQLSNVEYKRQI